MFIQSNEDIQSKKGEEEENERRIRVSLNESGNEANPEKEIRAMVGLEPTTLRL